MTDETTTPEPEQTTEETPEETSVPGRFDEKIRTPKVSGFEDQCDPTIADCTAHGHARVQCLSDFDGLNPQRLHHRPRRLASGHNQIRDTGLLD